MLRMLEKGTLYVCATPIGNLGDITLRALDTLREADLIAAEDTRHSRKLLEHYGIKTPMTSYHEHNEKSKARELITKLQEGQTIALISDAGLPGISDPGAEVIRLCQREKIKVDVLPGANAALAALILSGMPNEHFAFHGFLPASAGARKRDLEGYAKVPLTQIFYEAPHRLLDVLTDMQVFFGNREAAVIREITKLHQSVHKGTLEDLLEEFRSVAPRGECCIVVGPYVQTIETGSPEEWRHEVELAQRAGLKPNEAMKEVAKKYSVSKREIYQAILDTKEN